MQLKQQLLDHLRLLHQHNQQMAAALEKYRQETDYACLKTGIPDWQAFLAALRAGRLTTLPPKEVSKLEGESAAMTLLNELFENAPTTRSSARKPFCECESPVCSEGSVRHAQGGDTSRTNSEEPVHQSETKPQETLEQILREIEQYEQQRTQPLTLQGFDTFRKPEQDTLNETAAYADSAEKSREAWSGRSLTVEHAFHPLRHGREQSDPQNWWSHSPSPLGNEYTLAVENTKLRKQLRELQSRLPSQPTHY